MLNKIVGTLALGGAAYLLRNEESRTKVMNQLKSLASPENIEKIKNQFRSFSTQNTKENSDQSKLLESLSDPAFPDFATTARAEVERP